MEDTAELVLSMVEAEVKAPDFDKNDILEGRTRVLKAIQSLNMSESSFLFFLIKKINFISPFINLKHSNRTINSRQNELIKNAVIDKAIHDVLYKRSLQLATETALKKAQSEEEIITNLTTVRTNGKFPKSDIARRASLLRAFSDFKGNNSGLYEGSELRILNDFANLNPANQDRVISILTQKISPTF